MAARQEIAPSNVLSGFSILRLIARTDCPYMNDQNLRMFWMGLLIVMISPWVKAEEGVLSGAGKTSPPDIDHLEYHHSPVVEDNRLSISLDDVPLQDVLRLFARVSGANLATTTTNIQGRVSVNYVNVEWRPALKSILKLYSLDVVEDPPASGLFIIVPIAPGSQDPLIAQAFVLNYASVSNVTEFVGPMIGKAGTVTALPFANTIVVQSTIGKLNEIHKVIQVVDSPRQQVYIEAKFLELTDEAIKDVGVNWQVLEGYGISATGIKQTISDERSKFNGNRTGLGTVDSDLRSKGASGSGTPGSGATDSRTSSDTSESGNSVSLSDSTADGLLSTVASSGKRSTTETTTKTANYSHEAEKIAGQYVSDVRTAILSADDFNVVLSALQQINGVSIVSNPKIMVANEATATIHIGEMEPNIKGTVTPGQQGQANSTTYALDEKKPYFEFGISLIVTPTINTTSNITIRIRPTLTRFVSNKTAPDANTYPIEASKTIDTIFSLDSGHTAVIGGLTETSEREEVKKIPLLGDIPLIGKYLFSHTHSKRTQTETVIFVTVGLANSKTVERTEGLPEDASLVRQRLAALRARRQMTGGTNVATEATSQLFNDFDKRHEAK